MSNNPTSQPTAVAFDQWSIDVDFTSDGSTELEASATLSNGQTLHWSSTDSHTLMAAIGRDLAAHIAAMT